MEGKRILLAVGVFLALAVLITYSQENFKIITLDKNNYTLTETVTITLNYSDLNGSSLEIISPVKIFHFPDPQPAIKFIPKSEGIYSINFFKETLLLDSFQFLVGSLTQPAPEVNNSIDEIANLTAPPTTSSIRTDKQDYYDGEEVSIIISASDNLDRYALEMVSAEKTYRFFKLSQGILKFLPASVGNYELVLYLEGMNVSTAQFVVHGNIPDKENIEADGDNLSKESGPLEELNTTALELTANDTSESMLKIWSREKTPIKFNLLSEAYDSPDVKKQLAAFIKPGRHPNKILALEDSKIKKIKFYNPVFSNISALRIDKLDKPIKINNKFSLDTYAIDPGSLEFDNATVTATATGKELWKCRDWDFDSQQCLGIWIKIKDIVPGENYTFSITRDDPGFAETGVTTINTVKPIYRPGETAEIMMVVLDRSGYLVENADVTLTITSPDNESTFYSTPLTLAKIRKGIYSAEFAQTSVEGDYTLFMTAQGINTDSNYTTYFTVKDNYEFDILRETPIVIDPWKEDLHSKIRLISNFYEGAFSFTEVLPEGFTVQNYGTGEAKKENGSLFITWNGLTNNSIVSYTAAVPKNSPNAYELGPSYIEYGTSSFAEARPWVLAVDPRAVTGIVVFKNMSDTDVKYALWNSTTGNMTETRNGPNVGSPPTIQKIRCLEDKPYCILLSIQENNGLDFVLYNETTDTWSAPVALGAIDYNYQSFDVECEDLTGNCLIAYETSAAGNNQFSYRIYNVTSDTLSGATAVTITAASAFAFRFVKLYPQYGTNNIGIVLQNSQTTAGEYEAAMWKGNGFYNWSEVFNANSDLTRRTFDCAWEGNTSDFMCFYTRNTINNLYATYYNISNGVWTDQGIVWAAADIGNEPTNVFTCGESSLTGDLSHNDIIVMMADGGSDRLGAVWKGSSVDLTTEPSQDTDNTEYVVDDNAFCSWEHDGDTAVMGWVDADNWTLEWGTYNYPTDQWSFGSWGGGSQEGSLTLSDDMEATDFALNPENDQILIAARSYAGGAGASAVAGCTRWTGSTMDTSGCGILDGSNSTTQTGNRELTGYMAVDWMRYNAPPMVISLEFPLNNTNVTRFPLNFTFNVTDDIGFANCSLYLNLSSGWDNATTSYDILNNQQNNISYQLPEGTYTWNILCYDSSTPSKSDWYDFNYTFRYDPYPPNVTDLMITPVAQIVNLPINISVSVVDYNTLKFVRAEIVWPNSTVKNLTMNYTGGKYNLTFTDTRALGQYNITVLAEDLFGNLNSTIIGTFNVSLEDLSIYTDKEVYVPDETVYFYAKGFNPFVNVTLYLYDPTGDTISGFPINFSSNLTGGINASWLIPNNPTLGYYTINATETIDTDRSINATFRVVSAILESDKSAYEQGELVIITGYNWDNNVNVTVNITDTDGIQVFGPINISSNSTGYINTTWTIPYSETTGVHTLRGYEPGNPSKKSSFTFTVNNRPVSINSQYPWYRVGEMVNITGTGFSPYVNVTLIVYNSSGNSVSHYPINITSNITGGVNDSFIISSAINLGIYWINATDTKYPNLNANSSFILTAPMISTDKSIYNDEDTVIITGQYFDRNKNVTINITGPTGPVPGYPKNISTDGNGAFTDTTSAIAGSQSQTQYNITVYLPNNPAINATANYSVLSVTTLTTNKQYYTLWEIVNISGRSYTASSTVDLFLKNMQNGGSPIGYPTALGTNSYGRFNHYFNASNYCPAEFNAIGTDTVFPVLLNASVNFTLRGWWNSLWQKRKPIYVTNLEAGNRIDERIFVNITGLSGNITTCANELRIISTVSGEEVPYNLLGGDDDTYCEIIFLANLSLGAANESNYYAYYNNSGATDPGYQALEGYYYTIIYDGFEEPTDFVNSGANCDITGLAECADSTPWDGFDNCIESDALNTYGVCVSPYSAKIGGRGLVARGGLDRNTAGNGLFKEVNSTPCGGATCDTINATFYIAASTIEAADGGVAVYVNDSDGVLTIVGSCLNAQGCEAAAPASMAISAAFVTSNLCTLADCSEPLTVRFTATTANNFDTTDYMGLDEMNITGYRRYAPNLISSTGDTQFYVPCEQIDVTPPIVNILFPPIYFNTTDITPLFNFSITDDLSQILNYSIYVDHIYLGQNGTAANNTNISINISALSEGRHVVTIGAIDKYFNAYNSTLWNITIDLTGPETNITQPANFTNISTNIFLMASVADNLTSVDRITFLYRPDSTDGWSFGCSDTLPPFRCTWDISSLADGNSYQISAYANDTLNNIGKNFTVYNITIDRAGPATTITDPLNYSVLTGTSYLIKANSSDLYSRVSFVQFFYRQNYTSPWVNLCTDTIYPYECSWDFSNAPEGGLYQVFAYANDSLSNKGANDTVYNLSLNMRGPNITNIFALPAEQLLGYPVDISANITDSSGVSFVKAMIMLPNGSQVNLTMLDSNFDSVFNLTFTDTILPGTHNLTIYANDILGNINISGAYQFNISYQPLLLAASRPQYVRLESVVISGNGFSAFSNVTINIYNSTGQSMTGYPKDVFSNLTGGINDSWQIPALEPLGVYYINATDKYFPLRSAVTSFEIVAAIVETLKTNYEQGEIVNITGRFWDNNVNVTINITDPDSILVYGPLNVSSNSTGYINSTWQSDFNATLGEYLISAYEPDNPAKYSSYYFNIVQRPVYVITAYPFYKQNEQVTIRGYGFSYNNNVTIRIYNFSGSPVAGYPKNITANSTGGISDSFVVANLAEGNYTINITDNKYPNLNNITTFEIALSTLYTDKSAYVNGEPVYIYGEYWTRLSNITIDVKNISERSITGYPKNLTSNIDGTISDSLTAQAIGLGLTIYNITAFNPLFTRENATTYFTVQRVALLRTDKPRYDLNELINISGNYFSPSGPVEILIRYLNNSGFAYYYPKQITSNPEGNITHQFNNTYLCPGSYVVEATDQTFTSLYANASFNISFINANYSSEKADYTSLSGTYNVYGGGTEKTYASDNDYEYSGGADYGTGGETNFNAFINYTFNITGLNAPPSMIYNLSFTLEYCHSGVQANPICSQGFPHEGKTNGNQTIAIFNFTGNNWFNLTNLIVNDSNDYKKTIFFNQGSSLSDFIRNNSVSLRIELDFNQTGAEDDILLVDYLAMNVTYDSYVDRACSALTSKYLQIINLNKNNELISGTKITIFNSTGTSVDSATGSYFRYLPPGEYGISVLSPSSPENITYSILSLNLSQPTNITSQINENYTYALPDLIMNITPIIAFSSTPATFSKATLTIPKRGVETNNIMHCTNYNFLTAQCMQANINVSYDYEFSENSTYIKFNVTSLDAYAGATGISLPNLTQIRIYNVSQQADTHRGGTLLYSSLNSIFNLTYDNTYRIEFLVKNDGRGWVISPSDYAFQDGLNSSWSINASADIWYNSSSVNYTGGNFTTKVEWNMSQGGDINANETITFSYVVKITTNQSSLYNVSFRINDTSVKRASTDNSTFRIIDTILPYINLNYLINAANSSNPVVFNWTVFDNTYLNATCNLLINGITNITNISSRISLSTQRSVNFANGTYSWSVNCTDYDGNYNISETRSFTVDLAGPQTEIKYPLNFTNITANYIDLNATSYDNTEVDTVTFIYRRTTALPFSVVCRVNSAPYNCTWNVTTLQDANSYEIRAYANDTLGNIGLNSTVSNITIDRNGPQTAITNPSNFTNITGTYYNITATSADVLSAVDTVTFLYRKNNTAGWTIACVDNISPYNCTWDINILEETNSYQLTAFANDTLGNIGQNYTTVNITIDRTGPITTITSPVNFTNISMNYYNITATSADAMLQVDTVTFLYRKNNTAGWTLACTDKAMPYNCTLDTSALEETTSYQVRAYSNDTLGNIGQNYTVTNITLDRTGPVTTITAPVNFTNISMNYYNITATSVDNLLQVDTVFFYYRKNNTAAWTMVCTDKTVPYNCTLDTSALEETTSYQVRAYSNDTFGNIGQNYTVTNITLDRTGPVTTITAPVNFTNITATSYNIQATANDAFSAVDTVVFMYRDSPISTWTFICNDNSLPYTCNWGLSSFIDGNSYQVKAYANDSLGNYGQNFTVGNITIAIRPPNVTALIPAAGSIFNVSSNITIGATVTDVSGISGVYANITLPNGAVQELVLLNSGADDYSINFTNMTLRGRYNITIFANDSFGNINNSQTTYFTRIAPNSKIVDLISTSLEYIPYNITVLGNVSGILTLSIMPYNYSIKEIRIFNHSESSPYSIIRIENSTNDNALFLNSYMLDLSYMNLTSANVTITARGYHLLKCADFNISSVSCNDDYSVYAYDLVAGSNFTLTLNSTDPGFGETIQGQANISDSYMRQGRVNANYGGATNMRIGKFTGSDAYRSIIWFNLSHLPAGIQVQSANLSLYFYNIATNDALTNRTHGLHRVQQSPIRPWTELGVTWNRYDGSNSWTAPGGDYTATASANRSFNNSKLNSWIVYDLASDVNAMAQNQSSNFGWIIKDEDEATLNTRRDYYTTEYGTASLRPKLDIFYIDVQSPGVLLDLPDNNTYTGINNISFYYNVTENIGFSNCSIYLNGELNKTNTTIFNNQRNNFTFYNIQDNIYAWNITCIDSSGLVNSSGIKTIYIDTKKPAINLTAPQNGQKFGNSVNFSFIVIDNLDLILNCSLVINNSVNQSNIAAANNSLINLTVPFAGEGTYYWNITCSDNATNINTSETRAFIISLAPPQASGVMAIPNYTGLGQKVMIKANITDIDGILWAKANITKPDGSELIGIYNFSGTDQYQGLFNSSWRLGVYNFTIISMDMLGNQNISGLYYFIINSTSAISVRTLQDVYGPNQDVNLTSVSEVPWWDASYIYRKNINISNQDTVNTLENGYTFNFSVDTTGSKFLTNGNDLRIVYWNGSSNIELDRINDSGFNNINTQISFKIQKNISANSYNSSYYVYYGNPTAGIAPQNKSKIYDFWDDFSGNLSLWTVDAENTDAVFANQTLGNPAPSLMHAPDSSQTKNAYFDTRLRTTNYRVGNGIIEYDLYLAGAARIIHQFGFRVDSLSFGNGYAYRQQSTSADGGFMEFTGGAWAGFGTQAPAISAGSWHHVVLNVSGSTYTGSADGGSTYSGTDATKLSADYLVSHIHGVTLTAASYALLDNIKVRKTITTAPRATLGNEEMPPSILQNTGATNVTGYLYMAIDSNVTGSWVFNYTVVDDMASARLRDLTAGSQLGLSSIWNGPGEGSGWNTGNAASGYYRVRAQLTDNNSIVLENGLGSYISATYVFYLDITPPVWYFSNVTNTTPAPGTVVNFSANWTDNFGLANWQFFWKVEGDPAFTMQSSGNFGGSYNWSIASVAIPASAEGKSIEYYFRAFDSQGAMGTSNISNITVRDVTSPLIIGPQAVPQKIYRNETVNISATITDNILMDSAWANVTRPDGSIIKRMMINSSSFYSVIFSNTSQNGRYNVTIYANDTTNNLGASSLVQFDVYGRSNVTYIYPIGASFAVNTLINLTCRVNDHNASQIVANYPVDFYVNNTYLGTNNTDALGIATRAWNITGIGYTQVNCTISNFTSLYYDVYFSNANSSLNILVPNITLKKLEHENNISFNLDEYETYDVIHYANVTVNNSGGANATNVQVIMNVLNSISQPASWFNTQVNNCSKVNVSQTCTTQFNNSNLGYNITVFTNTGLHQWNITMNWSNGGIPPNSDSRNFTVYHVPDNITVQFNQSEITPASSTKFFVNLTDPWTRNLTGVNITINCPAVNGLNCTCSISGSNTCRLGQAPNRTQIQAMFNITTNATTPIGDYGINITIEYVNPGNVYHRWNQIKSTMLTVKPLVAFIIDYPRNITRGKTVFNLTGYAINIGTGAITNVTLNWTLQPGWLNITGSLKSNKSILQPGEKFWSNLTVNTSANVTLGPRNIIISTFSPDANFDDDIVSITVFAETNLSNISVTNSYPYRGDTIIIKAKLIWDNSSDLANQTVYFQNSLTNVTNLTGWAQVSYQIPASAPLGINSFMINVSYPGNGTIYTLNVSSFILISVRDRINISTEPIPRLTGYGQQVNIQANITSGVPILTARANVTLPDSSGQVFYLYNTTAIFFMGRFNNTWARGYYNYTVLANNTGGFENESLKYNFEIRANATFNYSTIKLLYGANEVVNLTKQSSVSAWWNSSFSYRQIISITENSGSALSSFQVNLTVNTSGPIAAGKMRADCGDIRFTDNNTNVLSYFIESGCNSASTVIWIKANLAASQINKVYMYYGNATILNNSNGTTTFDYYDASDQTSSWTLAGTSGQSVAQGNPIPSYYAASVNGNYMYRNIGLTTNRIVEFDVRSDGLGDFFFLTNAAGAGQHFRAEARLATSSGIAAASTWTAWSAPAACANIATNTWYNFRVDIGSTTAQAYINGATCGGAYTFANNGGYIGLIGDGLGGTYTTWWDNIKVRKYATAMPTSALDREEAYDNSALSNLADTGSTNISGYAIMSVERNDSGSWTYITNVVNDTKTAKKRNVTAYTNLDIASIWNGPGEGSGFNTLTRQTAQYRIVAALVDPVGNLLSNDDNSIIQGYAYFWIDTTPPVVTIFAPQNSSWFNYQLINFSYIPNDTSLQNCSLWGNWSDLGWHLNETNTSPENELMNYFGPKNIPEGKFMWSVQCFDSLANSAFGNTNIFFIDLSPPNIILSYPANNDNVSFGNINFTYTASDNFASIFNCSLYVNNLLVANLSSSSGQQKNFIYSIYAAGLYNWTANCTDIAGNSFMQTRNNFTVIRGPDSINISIEPNNNSIKLNWSTAQYAESYNIYISLNYSAGFSSVPNVTGIIGFNWTDQDAFESERRYYKVSAVKGSASALSSITVGKHTRQLIPAWNLISVPFNITDWQLFDGSSGKDIFTSPGDCIVSLWRFNTTNQSYERSDYQNRRWVPAGGSENFRNLEDGRGYWAEANSTCNLTFYGVVPTENRTFTLSHFWNIEGLYAAKDPLLSDESVLKTLDITPPMTMDNVILRYNTAENKFEVTSYFPGWGWWPSYNNQDFVYLNPLVGYYFDMPQDSTWVHDPNKG